MFMSGSLFFRESAFGIALSDFFISIKCVLVIVRAHWQCVILMLAVAIITWWTIDFTDLRCCKSLTTVGTSGSVIQYDLLFLGAHIWSGARTHGGCGMTWLCVGDSSFSQESITSYRCLSLNIVFIVTLVWVTANSRNYVFAIAAVLLEFA